MTLHSRSLFRLGLAGGAYSGTKYKMSIACPVERRDELRGQHRREEPVQVISVKRGGARLNRLPGANTGEMFMGTVKKGKPDLRKNGVFPAA